MLILCNSSNEARSAPFQMGSAQPQHEWKWKCCNRHTSEEIELSLWTEVVHHQRVRHRLLSKRMHPPLSPRAYQHHHHNHSHHKGSIVASEEADQAQASLLGLIHQMQFQQSHPNGHNHGNAQSPNGIDTKCHQHELNHEQAPVTTTKLPPPPLELPEAEYPEVGVGLGGPIKSCWPETSADFVGGTSNKVAHKVEGLTGAPHPQMTATITKASPPNQPPSASNRHQHLSPSSKCRGCQAAKRFGRSLRRLMRREQWWSWSSLKVISPQWPEDGNGHPTASSCLPNPLRSTTSQFQEFPPGNRMAQFTAMISYSHSEGQDYAVGLKRSLNELGVSCYLDMDEILLGSDWVDSLNEAITSCEVFVALVTPAYGSTLWTARELKLADLLGKHIIPVNFFDQQWPPAPLAIQCASLQYIRWSPAGAGGSGRGAVATTLDESSRRLPDWHHESVLNVAKQIKLSIERMRARRLLELAGTTEQTTLIEINRKSVRLRRHHHQHHHQTVAAAISPESSFSAASQAYDSALGASSSSECSYCSLGEEEAGGCLCRSHGYIINYNNGTAVAAAAEPMRLNGNRAERGLCAGSVAAVAADMKNEG